MAFLNLHENENTSVVAARSFLYVNGGSLVKFANGPNRLISFKLSGKTYSFDPNRMFTPEGIKSTLQTYSSYTEVSLCTRLDPSIFQLVNGDLFLARLRQWK
jgi:hypothetical protein